LGGEDCGRRLAARPSLHYTPRAAKTSFEVVSATAPCCQATAPAYSAKAKPAAAADPGRNRAVLPCPARVWAYLPGLPLHTAAAPALPRPPFHLTPPRRKKSTHALSIRRAPCGTIDRSTPRDDRSRSCTAEPAHKSTVAAIGAEVIGARPRVQPGASGRRLAAPRSRRRPFRNMPADWRGFVEARGWRGPARQTLRR
jgi:hypothetical protein